MKRIMAAVLMCAVLIQSVPANARTLTDTQEEIADELAMICIENWDEYGVLPSVCIGQAFTESTLGKKCRNFNLWGIKGGVYESLEDGVLGYLKTINNGYYDNAPFQKDYKKQLKAILDGGYCQPVGNYYSETMWTYDNYNIANYDKKLFRKLEQRRKFRVIHDGSIPEDVVLVDKSIIPSGAVCIYINYRLYKICDVASGGTDNVIRINDEMIDRFRVDIEVYEDAVG